MTKRFEYIKGFVFVGNITAQNNDILEKQKQQLEGINFIIGKQAYDIDGVPLSNIHKPLYIKEGKDFLIYDEMQMKKLSSRTK